MNAHLYTLPGVWEIRRETFRDQVQREQIQERREHTQPWSFQKYKEKTKPRSQANKHKTKKQNQLWREPTLGKEEPEDASIQGKGEKRQGTKIEDPVFNLGGSVHS